MKRQVISDRAMNDRESIQLENKPRDLGKLNRFLERFSRRLSLDRRIHQTVNLCLEEIFTNILRYAFENDASHRIDVNFRYENGILNISVEDDGRPFNPLDNPRPDVRAALKDRQVGGLGIHLVRSLMDRVSYDRKNNKNILTISKDTRKKTSQGDQHAD